MLQSPDPGGALTFPAKSVQPGRNALEVLAIAEAEEVNLSLLNRSVREGQSNPEGVEPVIYVGMTQEIDANEDEDVGSESGELAELLQPFRTPDGSVWRFAEDGIVERYEALNTDTGKVQVMWRAPFVMSEEGEQ